MSEQLGVTFEFEKANNTGSYVRGWASVVSIAGKAVEDSQGDVISIDELRKAAHKFVTEARVAKAMHRGSPVGEVVESIVVDDDVAKALDIGSDRRGWWIGMSITDEAIQKRVRSGELKAFSIGGKGRRTPIGA
jgi:Putative phage serine protease XkdF